MWGDPSAARAAVPVPGLPSRRNHRFRARAVPFVDVGAHICLAVTLGRQYVESFVASRGESSNTWYPRYSQLQRANERVFGSKLLRQAEDSGSTSEAPKIWYASPKITASNLALIAAGQLFEHGEVSVRGMGASRTSQMLTMGKLMPKLLRDKFNLTDGSLVGIVPEMEDNEGKFNVRFNYKLVDAHFVNESEVFYFGRSTGAGRLAGAIRSRIANNTFVNIESTSTDLAYKAVQAVIMAQSMLKNTPGHENTTLGFVPSFYKKQSKNRNNTQVFVRCLKLIPV